MGNFQSCCTADQDEEFTLISNTISQPQKSAFKSNRIIKSTLETEQNYENGQYTFISKESLPGVNDEYIQKQNNHMKRVKTANVKK